MARYPVKRRSRSEGQLDAQKRLPQEPHSTGRWKPPRRGNCSSDSITLLSAPHSRDADDHSVSVLLVLLFLVRRQPACSIVYSYPTNFSGPPITPSAGSILSSPEIQGLFAQLLYGLRNSIRLIHISRTSVLEKPLWPSRDREWKTVAAP